MSTTRSPEKALLVLLGGEPAGILEQDQHGQLSFTYDDTYRGAT